MYKRFKAISDQLNSFIKTIVGVMLITMAIVVTTQIICRVFFQALSYTEELSRYLLVWSSFFAASVAYKQGAHIAVTFLIDQFKVKARQSMAVIINLLSILFFCITFFFGMQLIHMQVFQTSPALLIPMRYVYLCIPISFSVMLFHGLLFLWEAFINLSKGGDA